MVKPYDDSIINSVEFIREFDCNVLSEELVWHRDHNDRLVTVLDGEGWQIQFENSLPKPLKIGDEIWIESRTYHRIKRGTSNLKLLIREYK